MNFKADHAKNRFERADDDDCNKDYPKGPKMTPDLAQIRKIIRDAVNSTIVINIIISNKSTRRFVSRKNALSESYLLLLLIVLSKTTKLRENCFSS